jgi:hypothetical protein
VAGLRATVANRLFLVICCSGLGACVGDIASPSGHAPPDARGPTADARVADVMPADAAPFRCRDRMTPLDSGHHNPGQDCMSGCHDHGFYVAGTIFSSVNGGQGLSGIALTFVDANGATGDMISTVNGNFWWSLPVAFPLTITASLCPDIQHMTAQVGSTTPGCNKGGCHVTGAAGRIHIP